MISDSPVREKRAREAEHHVDQESSAPDAEKRQKLDEDSVASRETVGSNEQEASQLGSDR